MTFIKYYPLARVKTNLYTRGTTYQLGGKPYAGFYYLTYKGQAFTGPNPAVGGNERLEPLVSPQKQKETLQLSNAAPELLAKVDAGRNSLPTGSLKSASLVGLKPLAPYYPVVTEFDYQRGYFTRYFAKRIADKGYIFEISYTDWANIVNEDDPTTFEYEVTDLLWQLTGPRTDQRVSQYQVKGGVETTNKRVTEAKAKNFIGLFEYIGGDYTKFARITP